MEQNEVVFRRHNERIKNGIEEIRQIAKEDSQEHMLKEISQDLHFKCECSDENCIDRVLLKPSVYDRIHKARNHFVVVRGHEVPSIERVIRKTAGYCVVEKFNTPPENVSKLQPTPVDNS
jgi:hypothetical protein